MDNITTFRVELDVAAQKVIHQFMLHNEHVEAQIKSAIEKVVTNFDFETEITKIAQNQLRQAIRDAMSYGVLERLVRDKAQAIYGEIIEKEFAKYK